MKPSKDSVVLLSLVVAGFILLFLPLPDATKVMIGPACLAAVLLASRRYARLAPDVSPDERDFLFTAQCLGPLTFLLWLGWLYTSWPLSLLPTPRPISVAPPPVHSPATPQKAASAEPSLLQIAYKVAPPVPVEHGFSIGINEDEVLMVRGAKQEPCLLSRRDLKTGRETTLTALSRAFEWWNHDHTALSPDGRWIVWRKPDEKLGDGLYVASLTENGPQKVLRWDDQGDEHDPIAFLPESNQWFTIRSDSRSSRAEAEIFDIRRPGQRRSLPLPNGFPAAEFVARDGTLIDIDEEAPLEAEGIRSAHIVRARLLPQPRVLGQTMVTLPTGLSLDHYAIAPQGNRIAWVCTRTDRTAEGEVQTASLWVTDGDGRNWKEIGALPPRPGNEAFYGLSVLWTQEGKRLRFERNDGIYEVGVPAPISGALLGGVPALARIAGFTVGDSTIEEMEKRLGKGFAHLGGHPRGARQWRIAGADAALDTDGMFWYSSGRGRMIDGLSISSPAQLEEASVPEATLSAATLRYQGVVELGMTRDAVLRALTIRLGPPTKTTVDTLEWTARGFHRINHVPDEDKHDWSARLAFREGRLNGICVFAD